MRGVTVSNVGFGSAKPRTCATGRETGFCVWRFGGTGIESAHTIGRSATFVTSNRRGLRPMSPTAIPTILNLDDMEKATIERALSDRDWQVRQAAEDLLRASDRDGGHP